MLFDFQDTFAKTCNNVGAFTYRDLSTAARGPSSLRWWNEPPPEIALAAPRLVGGQLRFEVTGLTVGKINVLQARPT